MSQNYSQIAESGISGYLYVNICCGTIFTSALNFSNMFFFSFFFLFFHFLGSLQTQMVFRLLLHAAKKYCIFRRHKTKARNLQSLQVTFWGILKRITCKKKSRQSFFIFPPSASFFFKISFHQSLALPYPMQAIIANFPMFIKWPGKLLV